MRKYKYSKKAGALQEAMPMQIEQVQSPDSNRTRSLSNLSSYDHPDDSYVAAHDSGVFPVAELRRMADETRKPELYKGPGSGDHAGIIRSRPGRKSMFFYTVEDGQRVMVINRDGTMYIAEGPCRISRRGKRIRSMDQHVAHPGEFLIVRYRDGRQEHITGPADVWFDSRDHMDISKEECIQIAEKEAIVVYSKTTDPEADGSGDGAGKQTVERRIVHGPEDFVPQPGEWLHSFSWHGSQGGQKVPNALVFQKLWLLPDQMYHDIPDVRTADGVVLTIRLMLFFQLVDIAKMLETTHDPIGDFVNAATSDVVAFVGKHDFESFKDHTGELNTLATYEQLVSRAELCGYTFNKVVYRGYGAPAALVQMHEQAMESRTRLQLEKATQQQAQDLEDLQLERRLEREVRERAHQASGQQSDLELARLQQVADLEAQRERRLFIREQALLDDEQREQMEQTREERQRQHLTELAGIGVDLTAYLTQSRADQVIELRGDNAGGAQVHLHDQPTRRTRE